MAQDDEKKLTAQLQLHRNFEIWLWCATGCDCLLIYDLLAQGSGVASQSVVDEGAK